jgi:hypothetical protein
VTDTHNHRSAKTINRMLPSPSARSNSTQIRTAAPGQSRFYSSIRYRTLVLINPACLQHNSQILLCGTAIMLIERYQGSRLSLAPFKHDSYVLTRAHISPPLPACLWILTTVGLKQFIARIVGPFAKCGVLAYILLSEGDPEVDNRSESCPTPNGPGALCAAKRRTDMPSWELYSRRLAPAAGTTTGSHRSENTNVGVSISIG